MAVVAAGGTIASVTSPGGAVAALSGREVVERAGCTAAEVGPVVDVARVNSSDMTPEQMVEIAATCRRLHDDPDVCGVVVLHGTDTLEETAFVCDLTVDTAKPIVFTGAMRPAGSTSADGPANLRRALRLGREPRASGRGTLICVGQEIFAPAWARKVDSAGLAAFAAPGSGPVGHVSDAGEITFGAGAARRLEPLPFPAGDRLPAVPLVSAYTGMPSDLLLGAVAEEGATGLVVEGFGAGNLPSSLGPSIDKLVADGVLVAVATRVAHGGARPVYGGAGGHAGLVSKGVLSSPWLTAAKTRLLLLLCLAGRVPDPRALFDRSVRRACPTGGAE